MALRLGGDGSTRRLAVVPQGGWREVYVGPNDWPVGQTCAFLPEGTYVSRPPHLQHRSTEQVLQIDSSNSSQGVRTVRRRKSLCKEASRSSLGSVATSNKECRTGTAVDCGLASSDEFAWTALISEHTKSGQARQALKIYREMLDRGVKPSSYTCVAALKACSSLQDLETAKQMHANVVINGFQSVAHVGNMLVDVYAKCGSLVDARHVFDTIPNRNVVSWTSMISGYAQMGEGEMALQLYTQMQQEGVVPNDRTYVGAIKACSSLAASEKDNKRDGLEHLRAIHLDIVKSGSESGIYVGTMLVDAYAKAESLVDSRSVFEKMPYRNVVSWNAMILGYVQMEEGEEALQLYARMKQEGVRPNDRTFGGVLKACSSLTELEGADGKHVKQWCIEQVRTIHKDIVKCRCDLAVFVWNMLMDAYVRCGSLVTARQVFAEIPDRSVVSWNIMIWGCVQMDEGQGALELYAQMLEEGFVLDDRTFVGALKACSSLATVEDWVSKEDGTRLKERCLQQVRAIHSEILKRERELSVFVGTMLVDVYAKCGSLVAARQVFDNIPHHDVVSWTAMISGYAKMEEGEEALQLFNRMQKEGVPPNELTFIGALKACSLVAGLETGKGIHAQMSKLGLETAGLLVPTSLIDMYCKCGSMQSAQQVFDALHTRPIATWNALISGYTYHGGSDLVFDLFQRMKQEGTKPDSITFLSILTVCSHAGLVDKGQTYLKAMSSEYGITPTIDHYTCVVDLLGRAGEVDKAMSMVDTMPFQADGVVWQTILSACQKWRDVQLGSIAFEAAVKLDEMDAAAYVLMSNVYAAAHMPEDANEIQAVRVQTGAWKKPGRSSWTDVNGTVHSFVVGDRAHPECAHICAKLEDLFVKMKR